MIAIHGPLTSPGILRVGQQGMCQPARQDELPPESLHAAHGAVVRTRCGINHSGSCDRSHDRVQRNFLGIPSLFAFLLWALPRSVALPR
jgi:hypothetical protein